MEKIPYHKHSCPTGGKFHSECGALQEGISPVSVMSVVWGPTGGNFPSECVVVVWGPTGGKFPSECVVCSVGSYRREIPQ